MKKDIMATPEIQNIDKGTTLMEIGQHCFICHDIDFLPYRCDLCKRNYCSNHKDELATHVCPNAPRKSSSGQKAVATTKLPPASSVFPDLKAIRQQAFASPPKPNSISSKLLADSKSLDTKISESASQALAKLKKFMTLNAKSSKVSKNTPSQFIIETSKLKNTAKGDAKIPESERVYIWVDYIPEDLKVSGSLKVPIFVSRSWPIGRLLDSASAQLKIKNENNKTTDVSKRLTIFRKERVGEKGNSFVYIPANGRVNKEIVTGDQIYLVRGASV
ncbi:unnamed protein product [Kuraishia capsulata CBS 1993]|uniref:ZFAND1-like ubiquitin-like domain-containing protein n=1 Tax=Kuraishia capsulata CBS 1993 TaxID=1382522 RepID=W6MPB4_9ASCO|nr:uncharacterized protein KUCA_T00004482001 [Kuraishia capsulata CBS 1993]CDK28499.1 unnamed protein product [Kuraishia capsulata CBS 1993]